VDESYLNVFVDKIAVHADRIEIKAKPLNALASWPPPPRCSPGT
jgi:hypothetical protein